MRITLLLVWILLTDFDIAVCSFLRIWPSSQITTSGPVEEFGGRRVKNIKLKLVILLVKLILVTLGVNYS